MYNYHIKFHEKKTIKISSYLRSPIKRILDIILSAAFILISFPLFVILYFLVLTASGRPVFFIHKRKGKGGKVIGIIKFRSMLNGASRMQSKYKNLNESDGPTFKIQNDPRFTKIGKILSKTGLDELPQFINVIKGEMSVVGPRPLPLNEANKLSSKDKLRELVKPGITSMWVINGTHKLSFKKWMYLDKKYIQDATLKLDLFIVYKTFELTLYSIYLQFVNH